MANEATRNFISAHLNEDVRQLALRGTRDKEVDLVFALQQIAGRQKALAKLPTWAALEGIIYPPHLSMEQCSSEMTAHYKASLLATRSLEEEWGSLGFDSFVDLTGGFGVDFCAFCGRYGRGVYVEKDAQLCAISSENFKLLGLNAEVVNADGTDYLHQLSHADLIFMDPARRDVNGGRTYGIGDCTPNVLDLLDELLTKAGVVMLKLSPMLDWRKAVSDIEGCANAGLGRTCRARVNEVHIVSVDNECKELLLLVSKAERPLRVVCVNLFADGQKELFEFMPSAAGDSVSTGDDSLPESATYLYEPNASVMKAGCFRLVAERFGVHQLDSNSHLFVAGQLAPVFPGRRFVVERKVTMNKRELKEGLAGIDRANVAVRNFPLSVADLRKRLKLRDGGDVYIFATTVSGGKRCLFICRKAGV